MIDKIPKVDIKGKTTGNDITHIVDITISCEGMVTASITKEFDIGTLRQHLDGWVAEAKIYFQLLNESTPE
tara:strand:+ start:143 stop:355 length:213 start_codon:yes stop_codon:yes gene_type:complete